MSNPILKSPVDLQKQVQRLPYGAKDTRKVERAAELAAAHYGASCEVVGGGPDNDGVLRLQVTFPAPAVFVEIQL